MHPSHLAEYGTRIIGAPNTLEHRTFLEQNGNVISPFHDVPLFADQNNGIFNMIVEVPRWTNAKMETSKEEAFNPIKQDIKKGRLRYVRNCFPHHGYIWNYGMFPQVRRASDTRFPRPDRPSRRPGRTPPPSTRRRRPRGTTIRSMSARSVSRSATSARSSKSRSSASWP